MASDQFRKVIFHATEAAAEKLRAEEKYIDRALKDFISSLEDPSVLTNLFNEINAGSIHKSRIRRRDLIDKCAIKRLEYFRDKQHIHDLEFARIERIIENRTRNPPEFYEGVVRSIIAGKNDPNEKK
jgi:hypothetical protein